LARVSYLSKLSFQLREDLHYKMTLENYERGAKIFSRGADCQQISFVISGEVELIVEQNNKDYQLDVLAPGSVIGSYSVINESQYQYSGKAKTNVSILTLPRKDLFEMAEESDDLTDALETVTRYILDNEVPECDYIISQHYNHMNVLVENLSMLSQPLLRFKNAIRKVMVLNRRRELRVFKLIELIMTIRQLKRKMANGIATQLEVTS